MTTAPVIVATAYPEPGNTQAAFAASVAGFEVTLDVRLEPTGAHRKFVVTGPRYRCAIPACWCDRTPCTGQGRWDRACKLADAKGNAGQRHRLDHCHGGIAAMHAQQVIVFAEAVLATYDQNHAGPSPAGGLPRGSLQLRPPVFLPLDGEQTTAYKHAPEGDWLVTCDSLRCRDNGNLVPQSRWPTAALAQSAVQRHQHWHRDPDAGAETAAPQGMALVVQPAEIERGDWFHNYDGWQRIELISTPRRDQNSIYIWDARENRIATLDQRREYLVVRSESEPDWAPQWDVAKQRYAISQ